ncbi:hypothetical protein [Paenibacillus sp. A3]
MKNIAVHTLRSVGVGRRYFYTFSFSAADGFN